MAKKHRYILYMLFLLPLFCVVMYAAEPGLNLISSEKLGGENRYLTHLSTDKPIYRGGETVHIRGIILNAKNNKPLPENEDADLRALLEIKGPKGDTVQAKTVRSKSSVVGGKWTVPDDQSGGNYTCKIKYRNKPFPPTSRDIEIRSYRTPRLKAQIEFLKEGYGPGDRVTASIKVERAEGGIPENAPATVIGRAGGEETHRSTTKLNADGSASVQFRLPEDLDSSQGSLSFVIKDGGVKETKSRPIPIVLNNLDLSLYPEGGELVADLPNRVYFEARNPAGKPVDLKGRLLDDDGNKVARLDAFHEGRGRFSFTPEADTTYRVSVEEPAGVSESFDLPAVKKDGISFSSVENVTPPDEPVRLRIGSPDDRTARITLRKREDIVAEKNMSLDAGEMTDVHLMPGEYGEGVLVATVYIEEERPVAERLVYRRPERKLNIALSTHKQQYTPGDEVALTVKTTDDSGDPVPAVVGLTATDESVLEMKPDREKAPRLRSMVYLENETGRLKDARVYLNTSHEKTPDALDLLLGTQGWRRFAYHRADAFLDDYGDRARRVLAYQTEPDVPSVTEKAARGRPDEHEALRFDAEKARPGREEPDKRASKEKETKEEKEKLGDRVARDEAMDREVAARRGPRRTRFHREYAHDNASDQRNDFTETVYWNAGVQTGSDGTTTVRFDLSDAITTFRVRAGGFTRGGDLGEATHKIPAVKPLYIEPKLPLHVTSGDRVHVPVAVANNTEESIAGVSLNAEAGDPITVDDADQRQKFELDAGERSRRWVAFEVGDGTGEVPVALHLQTDQHTDKVERTVTVEPRGFPADQSLNGVLAADDEASHTFRFPAEFVPDSLEASVTVYPSPLANMEDALASLIQQPHGCFEQTSSTNYPMVMAQQYFQKHPGVETELVSKTKKMLDKGYKKLVSFETEQDGYEWFGSTPPHEALTAYGLLEFKDMQEVYDVDTDMVRRTKTWLKSRRTGDGTFKLQKGGADSFGRAPENASQAYITWVLLETGETGLEREVEHVADLAEETGDSYISALAARSLWLTGEKDRARPFMKHLVDRQTSNGWIDGADTSVTRSGGKSLKIETTAFALLAWLGADGYEPNVEGAVRWILEQNSGGRFGSTQSTVMALKAILAYNRKHAAPGKAGELQLYMDGEPVGEPVQFTPNDRGKLDLPSFADQISSGEHTLSIRMTDGSRMPYAVHLTYNTPKPASGDQSKTGVDVTLTDQTIAEGDPLEVRVTVTNRNDEEIHMPVAIVGLPGGLEPNHEGLKDLVRSGKIASYETMGRELVLYWRGMAADAKNAVSIPLLAAVPGTYTGPASRSYLYYDDEHKKWIDPIQVEITK